jgi:hypothetical protein
MSAIKHRLPGIATLFLILNGFFACDFQPDKKMFKEMPALDLTGINMTLSINDGMIDDTIRLSSKSNFTIIADLAGRQVKYGEIFIDDSLVTLVDSDNTFELDVENYNASKHFLRVDLYADAGSGSLADQLGGELLKISKTWPLLVDDTPVQELPLNVVVENGQLAIKWNRYLQNDFTKYVISKAVITGGNQRHPCWTREITDPEQTILYDETFIGGTVEYSLAIQGGNELGPESKKEFWYPYNPELQYEWLSSDQLKIFWRRPAFPSNVHSYNILVLGDSPGTFENTDPMDTTMVVDLELAIGSLRDIQLEVIPKQGFCQNTVLTVATIGKILPFVPFYGRSITYTPTRKKYYAADENSLMRINEQHEVEQSMPFEGSDFQNQFALSENGEYLYVAYYNVVSQLDPLTFEVIRTLNLTDITDKYESGFNRKMIVSNTNTLAIRTFDNTLLLNSNFEEIGRHAPDYQMNLSASGEYFMVSDSIFRLQNGEYQFHGMLPVPKAQTIFIDDSQLLIVNDFDGMSVLDLNTMELQGPPFAAQAYSAWYYDPASQLIGIVQQRYDVYNTGIFYLYNLSGELLKTIDVANLDIHTSQYVVLLNNELLWSSGYSVPLSLVL